MAVAAAATVWRWLTEEEAEAGGYSCSCCEASVVGVKGADGCMLAGENDCRLYLLPCF